MQPPQDAPRQVPPSASPLPTPVTEPRRVGVTGDTELQTHVLEELRDAHRYRAWVSDLAEPWLGDRPLEVGSGIGDYAAEWRRDGRSFTASEADPVRLAALRRRFAGDDRVEVRELHAPVDEDADHSAVVAINVLEHIEQDAEALRAFARLVAPGGYVVLFVPAFPAAFSRFDAEVGHERRYTRATLQAALAQAGLSTVVLHHVNAPGLVAWFVGMRLLGLRPRSGPALRLYDRTVVPVARWIESRVQPPFGQSLFAVAQVTGRPRPAR